jgi:hypothetical protein
VYFSSLFNFVCLFTPSDFMCFISPLLGIIMIFVVSFVNARNFTFSPLNDNLTLLLLLLLLLSLLIDNFYFCYYFYFSHNHHYSDVINCLVFVFCMCFFYSCLLCNSPLGCWVSMQINKNLIELLLLFKGPLSYKYFISFWKFN